MPPRPNTSPQCQICAKNPSKYTCSTCYIVYCSVPCYKQHQLTTCIKKQAVTNVETNTEDIQAASSPPNIVATDPESKKTQQIRPLTSLNWPYVPDQSAYPDPLKRDDPKDLQLHQYEALATSSRIREILAKHEHLPALLTSVDKLRGVEREQALQKALGVTPPDVDDWRKPKEFDEDVLAFREFAEAVETAIRGGDESALGLNWGE